MALAMSWISRNSRGSLGPGKYAGRVVLGAGEATVPVHEVGKVASVLAPMGGRMVHAAGLFAGWAGR